MVNETVENAEEGLEQDDPHSLALERNLKTLSEEFQQKINVMGKAYRVDIKTKIGFTINQAL